MLTFGYQLFTKTLREPYGISIYYNFRPLLYITISTTYIAFWISTPAGAFKASLIYL